MCHVLSRSQRPEYVRWFQRRRCAGASRGEGDIFQGHEETFALNIREAKVDTSGIPVGVTVPDDMVNLGTESIDEALSQPLDCDVVPLQVNR